MTDVVPAIEATRVTPNGGNPNDIWKKLSSTWGRSAMTPPDYARPRSDRGVSPLADLRQKPALNPTHAR
jgi:hypothetical protein